ncbi:MAG: DUF1848 domain-containing protein [Alphaproteobacteria bacterium]|nr:DUF1848 domain-containing protein [Alphaproteobacteria bacterium]
MIVSASYRTDIPAFYGDWFMARLKAGAVHVRNPYGGAEALVSLQRRDVDGFVFWTRNAGPFINALAEIRSLGFPFAIQFTITGYPHALENRVVNAEGAVEQVRSIAEQFGPRAVVWRYDPILDTTLTQPAWHRENFARLAGALEGAVNEVVVSWATIYRKTKRNLGAAANKHGFEWRDPVPKDKRALIADLAAIAAQYGMQLTLCAQPELVFSGIEPARCIDAARLSDVAGRAIPAKTKGNRPGCACAQSRDIGAYDTCPHGCVYCYAVSDSGRARARFRAHDPKACGLR